MVMTYVLQHLRGICHEDSDYGVGCHRDPRDFSGREDPEDPSHSEPLQQLRAPQFRGPTQRFILQLSLSADRS
jgi:hypothetical protein